MSLSIETEKLIEEYRIKVRNALNGHKMSDINRALSNFVDLIKTEFHHYATVSLDNLPSKKEGIEIGDEKTFTCN